MAGVGRKRKDGNPLGLEPRVEWHHGQFRYLHKDGRKEPLGSDVGAANARARVYNDPKGTFGTVGFYLDFFLAEAKACRLPAGWVLSERTLEDYDKEADLIKLSPLGKMFPPDLVHQPNLIGTYRDERAPDGIGQVQANHALAALSSMYDWLIEKGLYRGLIVNPVKVISRFKRKPKARYVDDNDYQAVLRVAIPSVQMALQLAYRTLQRPADILGLPPAPARWRAVAGGQKKILPVDQGKRGRHVDIEVTPEIEEALQILTNAERDEAKGKPATTNVRKLATALVHGRDGSGYTEDGMAAMIRRYCLKAKVTPFGLMDIRSKGATDMYLDQVPLEHIQRLMAHKSVQTTEVYIKKMLATISTVAPNRAKAG